MSTVVRSLYNPWKVIFWFKVGEMITKSLNSKKLYFYYAYLSVPKIQKIWTKRNKKTNKQIPNQNSNKEHIALKTTRDNILIDSWDWFLLPS